MKHRRLTWGLTALLVLRPLFVPSGSVQADFMSVSATGLWPRGPGVMLSSPELFSSHVVRDGTLYLRMQTVWHTMTMTWASERCWNGDDLAAFRRDHPELEAYWPDPAPVQVSIWGPDATPCRQ